MAEQSLKEKLHAACDECRSRKLKCSGNHPICTRCQKEGIDCRYSPQKPMGRPRKRRRGDDSSEQVPVVGNQPSFDMSLPDVFGPMSANNLATPPDFDSLETNGFQPDTGFSTDLLSSLHPAGPQQTTPPTLNFDANSIDPSLWNALTPDHSSNIPQQTTSIPPETTPTTSTTPDTGPCSCISLTYLTITDLQSITDFSFPQVIPHLRSATAAAATILHCPQCPQQPFAAIQNVQSLHSLLSALAERYHRVLSFIETSAASAEASGQKKSFRVGDNSPENRHLHTGTLDCPMGFDLELDPKDWKRLCKKALKTEVMGGGHYQMPLVRLLDEMEERQDRWHVDKAMQTHERTTMFGERMARGECEDGGGALCLRMAHSVRRMIGTMAWEDD